MSATWTVDDRGDITVACPACGESRRFRDTVDDCAWASVFYRMHKEHDAGGDA